MNNMETIIEFFDFNDNKSGRGRNLFDNQVSVWYNKSYSGYNVTMANNIKTDKEFVKIGKLGDEICFVFSDTGIKLKKTAKNLQFSSRPFVELIFGELTENKNRKVFKLNKISKDVYVLPIN